MRILPFIISTATTAFLIIALNKKWSTVPPMGKFLSPQHGFWQNAEATDHDFTADIKFPDLRGMAEVYFDERLVPHIFAENDEDLYFVQGYIHAKFRLFQMDLQTKAAEGRASEIAGAKAINYDKEQRRLGMKFAAENALKEMEKDPVAWAIFSAYTKGVNAYIHSLKESEVPLEYKLLDFQPEEWTNLRTALLLKMMAKLLSSGTENDLAATNAKTIFTREQFNVIYPQVPDSLMPIVPKGTVFDAQTIFPFKPLTADSLYFGNKQPVAATEISKPDKNNGSNNWVVSGSKTQSGSPILSNDPHLDLSLPSIWFEQQLTTPASNTYGVSLPGSPFIIIGFNDSIAWGVTNAQRDVKDFYDIKFKDITKAEYWYNGQWEPTQLRIEEIKVKGATTVYDTVAYTIYGPVMFDESFSNANTNKQNLAVRWIAHDPSNEGITFYKLNRAENYDDYTEAIKTFDCPGQNFVFASKAGDIAIWQQGKFPARWDGQGLYIMPGDNADYSWQGFIPQIENPHAKNPERGFLESANQRPVDSTYPYFIPGSYITPRGTAIEHFLSSMTSVTPDDMKKLQGNYFNILAKDERPILLRYVNENGLNADAKRYLDIVKNWNLQADPASKGQTVHQSWWDSLEAEIWYDDINQSKPASSWPEEQTTMELLKRDSSSLIYIDNINTPETEALSDIVTAALNKASANLLTKENEGKLEWAKFKNPTIYHLLKDALMPFARTGLNVGGNGNIINAVTHSHGPSWRMIVHLDAETEAYGVYPAGQSGNPGSKYYDDFIDTWANGEYYKLWVMKRSEASDEKVKWTMRFGN
jgi:penicillin G amidase